MKLAGVIRVSSAAQAGPDKPSMEVQEKLIKDAHKDSGHQIVEWYRMIESATKGKAVDRERVEFERLLRDAVTDKWDGVVVAYANRWTRNVEDSAKAIRIFNNACTPRKAFFERGTPLPIHTAAGRRLMGLTVQLSASETDEFTERVMRNKFAKGAAGGWPYGRRPYGRILTRHKGGGIEWSIDPEAKRTMDRAYRMIVEQRITTRAVAERLGFSSRQAMTKAIKQAGGIGRYKQKNFDTGEYVWREVPIPPLLTDIQLGRIRKQLDANRRTVGKHPTWHDYLLRGKLRCAACGAVLIGTFLNGRRKYIHPYDPQPPGPECVRRVIASPAPNGAGPAGVEQAVFDKIQDWIRDNAAELRRDAEQQLGSTRQRKAEAIQRVADAEKDVADLERKILAKSDLHIKGAAKAVLERDLQKLSDRLALAQEDAATARRELSAVNNSKDDAERVAANVAYLLEASRWNRENKLRALDVLYGPGSLRYKEGVGLYINRKGEIDGPTLHPLSALVTAVEPRALERNYLREPEALVATNTTYGSRISLRAYPP